VWICHGGLEGCELHPDYCLLDYEFEEEHTRLDLIFDHEKEPRNCSCFSTIYCRHTKSWHRLLWLETDDWGVRDLFETFAYGLQLER
jgi:hypothetical protein